MSGLTAACDDSTAPAVTDVDLVVEYSDWNGWEPEHRPRPETESLAGREGATVAIDVLGGIELEVVDVDDDKVTVEVSEPMAPRNASGGIDLTDLTDTFVVSTDRPATFSTPTMDAGWNVEIRFDEVSG